MKKLLVSLALLVGSSAFAGNEGPQAAPDQPQVIARVVVGSFFVPPGRPVSTSVTISTAGAVVRTDSWMDGRSKTVAVATLSPEITAKLVKASAAVQPGELVDPNPSEPSCQDAPSTTYYAVKNQEIAIGARQGCKDLYKENSSDADMLLKSALEAALNLSYLAK